MATAIDGLGKEINQVAVNGYNKLSDAVVLLHEDSTSNLQVIVQNQTIIRTLLEERKATRSRLAAMEKAMESQE